MFYRLNAELILRGWKNRPWNILNEDKEIIETLNAEEFATILLCDGITDVSLYSCSDEEKRIIRFFLQEGIISAHTMESPVSDKQLYRFYDNRYIRSGIISITGRCNFRCRHCYMDAPTGILGELSLKDAKGLIDQMVDCGIFRISITGGEPLVYKYFWQLMDYISEKELIFDTFYTNGWLLNDYVLNEFEKRRLKPEISISFDGLDWHDWMRGIKGAEEKTIQALKLCVKRGFGVDVEMCLHQGNRKDIARNIDFLVSIGVHVFRIGPVADTHLWIQNCEGNSYSMKEYYDDIIEYIPYYVKNGVKANILAGGVIAINWMFPDNYTLPAEKMNGCEECMNQRLCTSAYYNCYITPEGRMLPCMPMLARESDVDFPSVIDLGFQNCIDSGEYQLFMDKKVKDLVAANKECRECEYVLQCGGGCRASALMDGEFSLMGVDPYRCIFWKEGYIEKIRHAVEHTLQQ